MLSLSGKKWQVVPGVKKDFLARFPEFDQLTLQLLFNRGLNTQEKIDEFFNPDYSQDLFDPFLFKDMDRAVERIERAVKKKERVGVFGDYDADGVTASVLLMELLRDVLGLQGQVYIPNRATEGYGMNKPAIDWLAAKNIQLIITCDCGVSNQEEIDYAAKKGIDVIVTDHHHLPHQFSRDYIVIDAKRKGDKYPYKELAGVGVVFKLIQAIFKDKKNIVRPGIDEGFVKKALDLVALGTVADCSPIISENRTLLKYGLAVLKDTQRAGLQALMEVARVDRDQLDAETIGFSLAPRINSAGRLDHANSAFKLLTTRTATEARHYAHLLQKTNYQRQRLTDKITVAAKKQIGSVSSRDKILFAKGQDWPLGVVGIVAGKITEEFSRPTLILEEGIEESAGSGRSTEQFNLVEAIAACRDLLLEYGGHKAAAGFALKNDNFAEFVRRLKKIAQTQITAKDLVSKIIIDARVKLAEINWDLYSQLQNFAPHGEENEKPRWEIDQVTVKDIKTVGKDSKHLKMNLATGTPTACLEAIGFNLGKYVGNIKRGEKVDVVGEIDCNTWNGTKTLQMKVIDIRKW